MSERTYGQACPVAHALDAVGDRWALLMIRDLVLGPKRFSDLRAGLPGIAPTVLSGRLRALVDGGVVHRHTRPPPAASTVYELTDRGRALAPVLRALAAWGLSQASFPDGRATADTAILGLVEHFTPSGPPWTATVGLAVGTDRYEIRVVDGELAGVGRGEARWADATVRGDVDTVHGVATGRVPATALHVDGDRALGQRFLAAAGLGAAVVRHPGVRHPGVRHPGVRTNGTFLQ